MPNEKGNVELRGTETKELGSLRFTLNAEATGPESSRITIADRADPDVSSHLDLPAISKDNFDELLGALRRAFRQKNPGLFPFDNYIDAAVGYHRAERAGVLTVARADWSMRFLAKHGEPEPETLVGDWRQYNFDVSESSPSSSRIAVTDRRDTSIVFSFDLPETPPPRILAVLGQAEIKADASIAEQSPVLIADELAKLSDLHAKRVLTDDEFAAQKAKLLAAN